MRLALPLTLTLAALSAGALLAQIPASAIETRVPTANEARDVAQVFAEALEANFVFPDIGKRYAAALRAKAAGGSYDALASREALADALTADVQAIARDGHLRVFPRPPEFAPPPAGQPAATPPPVVEKQRWIAPGVAFIRFNGFPGSPESIAATQAFVRDYASAETLIIDFRTHRGGGLAEMDVLFPVLFDRPTRLVTMETRAAVVAAGGEPLGDIPTLKRVPSSPEVVQREHWALPAKSGSALAAASVYLLTSPATASAAEHFALAMKRTHRATLIGEPSGGAGHYGGIRPLTHGFLAFVPVGRTFDPDTNKGWEGTGVAPDIAVPAKQALAETLRRVGVAPAEAERLSAELEPQWPALRPRRTAG